MGNKTYQISFKELLNMQFIVFIGFYMMITPLQRVSNQNSWLIVVIATFLALLMARIYIKWHKTFGKVNFFTVIRDNLGVKVGKIIFLLYAIFFFFLSIVMMWFIATFWMSLGLNKTPQIYYIALLGIFVFFVTNLGIEVIVRYCSFTMLATLIFAVTLIVLLSPQYDTGNLLPLFDIEVGEFSYLSLATSLIIFGDLIFLLPHLHQVSEGRKVGRAINLSIIFAGIFILAFLLIKIMVLGETASLYTFPTIQLFKIIDFQEIFSRVEIIGVIFILVIAVIRLALAFFNSATMLKEVFAVEKIEVVSLAMVILAVFLATDLFSFISEVTIFIYLVFPVIYLIFAVILPILVLIVNARRENVGGI